jgi:uncharacterized protein
MCKVVDDLARADQYNTCYEFHGGEPTMALADIQAVVKHAQNVYSSAGKNVSFSIQSNGFRLSDECCVFLAQNNFSVRISLDGTPSVHDRQRVDHRGHGTYARIVQNIRRLQEHGVTINTVCVLHQGNAAQITDMYDSMADLGVSSIRFLPIFKGGVSDTAGIWLNGNEYHAAYWRLINHILARHNSGLNAPILSNLVLGELGSLLSFKRTYMCMRQPCGAGTSMVCVDDNGDAYPCEEMGGMLEFKLGNVYHDNIADLYENSPRLYQLRSRACDSILRCSTCTWRQMCSGGCAHKSYVEFRDLTHESEHCDYYRRIFEDLIWLEDSTPGSWQKLGAAFQAPRSTMFLP